MKQEFVTVKGKVVIKNDVMFIKTLHLSPGEGFWFGLFIPLLTVFVFVMLLIENTQVPRWYMRVFSFGILTLFQLPRLYDSLFRKSFANRIPLSSIIHYEIKPDLEGLETEVILKLSNGRYRKIHFRTMENQFQPFLNAIAQSSLQLQHN